MRNGFILHRLVLHTCLLAALGPSAQATVIINDPFDNGSGDYSGTQVSTSDPLNYSYLEYDGSPGADSLIAVHIHDVERDENDFPVEFAPETPDLQSLFLFTSTSYTPSISGAIGTVDFKIDYRTTDPFSDLSFFIQNGGGSGAVAGFTTPNNDGQWHTLEVLGLTTADFVNIDFEGSSALRFGFGFFSSAFVNPTGNNPVPYEIEVDNFSVTVNPVPEPSPGLILLAGAAPLILRRRRAAPF